MKTDKPTRKAIGKRLRFSIFARDQFTCRYCGRQSDQVKLVIDHIKPVANGGDNDESNLLTSCEACNLGKSDKELPSFIPNETTRLSLAQEFQEQNARHRMIVEAAKKEAEISQEICNVYCEITGRDSMSKACLRRYCTIVKEVGPELLFEWFRIAAERVGHRGDIPMVKYIYGIRRKALSKEGES